MSRSRYLPGDLVCVLGSKIRVVNKPWVGKIKGCSCKLNIHMDCLYEVEAVHPIPGELSSHWYGWELRSAGPLDAIAEIGD